MANFYRDNDDLRYYIERGLDWGPLVEATEYGWRAPDAWTDVDEAVEFYGEVLDLVGDLHAASCGTQQGLLVQEGAVRLHVHDAPGPEQSPVALQKGRAGQALGAALVGGLRVRERQPYLVRLPRCQVVLDELDLRTQEGGVGQSGLGSGMRPMPITVPLDVHADEIALGMLARELQRVLPLAATQLQGDGALVAEHPRVPLTPHFAGTVHGIAYGGLKDPFQAQVGGPLLSFGARHDGLRRIAGSA